MKKSIREKIGLIIFFALFAMGGAFICLYLFVGHSWNRAASSIDDSLNNVDGYSVIVYEGINHSEIKVESSGPQQVWLEPTATAKALAKEGETVEEDTTFLNSAIELARKVKRRIVNGSALASVDATASSTASNAASDTASNTASNTASDVASTTESAAPSSDAAGESTEALSEAPADATVTDSTAKTTALKTQQQMAEEQVNVIITAFANAAANGQSTVVDDSLTPYEQTVAGLLLYADNQMERETRSAVVGDRYTANGASVLDIDLKDITQYSEGIIMKRGDKRYGVFTVMQSCVRYDTQRMVEYFKSAKVDYIICLTPSQSYVEAPQGIDIVISQQQEDVYQMGEYVNGTTYALSPAKGKAAIIMASPARTITARIAGE